MASADGFVLCPYYIWWWLFRQLRQRDGDVRETGAFLLGERRADEAVVRRVVFYDDIDPSALLTGIVRLSGHAMNAVWQTCADTGLEVLADIHTHPGGSGQSRSDQDYPMVALKGHLALIAPRFASRTFDLARIGVYRYRGSKRWEALPAPRPGWTNIKIGDGR